MLRPTCLLLLPLLAAACAMPTFVARKSLDMTVPVDNLRRLQCESHNGSITVTAEDGRKDVDLHAEFSVRGYTQAEADANLQRMELVKEAGAGSLHVYGQCPEGFGQLSPTFTFALKVPKQVAVVLASHNGNLTVHGVEGAAQLETHNGNVDAAVVGERIDATSHNGDLLLHVASHEHLDGDLVTHNGDIQLALDGGANTTLNASTHNGRVTGPASLREARVSRTELSGKLGTGAGSLRIVSHNGNIDVR